MKIKKKDKDSCCPPSPKLGQIWRCPKGDDFWMICNVDACRYGMISLVGGTRWSDPKRNICEVHDDLTFVAKDLAHFLKEYDVTCED